MDYKLLAKITSANMNSTSDQIMAVGALKYVVDKIIVTNASASLTLAAGGIYTAASKGGTAVVGAGQVFTALTGTGKFLTPTIAVTQDVLTAGQLFLSLTTGQGTAATADLFVWGYEL